MDELKGLGKDHILNKIKNKPKKPTKKHKSKDPDKRRAEKLSDFKGKTAMITGEPIKGGVDNV